MVNINIAQGITCVKTPPKITDPSLLGLLTSTDGGGVRVVPRIVC